MSKNYVAYYFSTTKNTSTPFLFGSHRSDPVQEAQVQAYLQNTAEGRQLIASFTELPVTQRNRQRWPELEKCMAYCREHQAILLIAELRNLTNNEKFSDLLLDFIDKGGELICCDQPFVDRHNFKALVEHARQHRKFHGQLIKQGLERTNAKSGNPNAKEVIDRVNRPKIENAIVFALLLQPVVETYRQRGYSQRRMVNALNHEGIHAPEGGRWVLSQLQKVLERIKINEAALALELFLKENATLASDPEALCQGLQQKGILPPRGHTWEQTLLEEVQERCTQLINLKKMNELLLELLPILATCSTEELSPELILQQLYHHNISLSDEPLAAVQE